MRAFMMLTVLALGLSGCKEVKIQNGEIPNEYIKEAQQFVGTYQGSVERQPTTVTVALQGNRMVVTAAPDILDARCGSSVGNLLSVLIGGRSGSYFVERATFAFNAGGCMMVEGREVSLSVRYQNNQVQMWTSILDHSEWRETCEPQCTPHGGCTNICNRTLEQTFVRGSFVRVN